MKHCPVCNNKNPVAERVLNGIQLAKCQNCTFVYADMTEEQVKETNFNYGSTSDDYYAEIQSFLDEAWFDFTALRMTGRLGTGRILDVGCGNGLLLSCFARHGWMVEGLDVSPWADKYAQQRNFTLHKHVIEDDSLRENSFDLVTSTSVLEHIADPCRHVAAILRVLKPGRPAYFAGIPNYGSASIRLGVSSFFDNTPPGHVNFFDTVSFRNLFKNPEINNAARRVKVITYGVPELHRMVSFVRQVTGRLRRNRHSPQKTHSRQTIPSPIPGRLARTLILLWHAAGSPCGLGDKLEAIVEKR